MPDRIQLSRAKGWRMPPNTVSVARGPGRTFGNPFTVKDAIEVGIKPQVAADFVVRCFDNWLRGDGSNWMGEESDQAAAAIIDNLHILRGKSLACWCPPGSPCHADVLMKLANASETLP
jgi:hypothetical protein